MGDLREQFYDPHAGPLDNPKVIEILARVIENRHGTLHGIGDTLREALAEIKREVPR